jgi:hypothetical protein
MVQFTADVTVAVDGIGYKTQGFKAGDVASLEPSVEALLVKGGLADEAFPADSQTAEVLSEALGEPVAAAPASAPAKPPRKRGK